MKFPGRREKVSKPWRLVLTTEGCPSLATDKEPEFVVVLVTHRRRVPDMWCENGSTKQYGYEGRAKDGRVIRCNWDSFPSDSMTPMWSWWGPDDKKFWYDVTVQTGPVPKPKWLRRKDIKDVLAYCATHKRLYLKDSPCFRCELDEKYPKTAAAKKDEKVPFKGW